MSPLHDPILAASQPLATLQNKSALGNLEILIRPSFGPLRDVQWLFRSQENSAHFDETINGWQDQVKGIIFLVVRLDWFGVKINCENASLLDEYKAIQEEKLPLINSNPLVDVSVFTQRYV